MLETNVVEEAEVDPGRDKAIVLGLAADAAKAELPRADRSIMLACGRFPRNRSIKL